jgi:hypothetical protein
MADLKPIGSEKLTGESKIKRILEISRYKENIPSNINETDRTEYSKVLSDGKEYEIVKEKMGYVIKKRVDESYDYIEPMKNRKHYSSYSAALKRLNLIAKEVNRLTENQEETPLLNIGEQKKFTLKTPKPPVAPDPVTSQPVAPQEMPSVDVQSSQTGTTPPDDLPPMDMSQDMSGSGEQMDDMGDEMPDMGAEMPDMGDEMPSMGDREEVTFRTVQKLTGKLGQKLRMLDDSVGMTSEDIKYVLNSILSAVNLAKLDDEDREDILTKFEEDYDEDMMGSDEMNTDMEMDIDTELDTENSQMSPTKKEFEEDIEDDSFFRKKVSSLMDSVFAESEVEKLLSQYYRINENEQLQKKNKNNHYKKIAIKQVRQLAETKEQRESAEFIIRETSGFKFKGKTNLKNLVFEHEDNILKISLDGEFL